MFPTTEVVLAISTLNEWKIKTKTQPPRISMVKIMQIKNHITIHNIQNKMFGQFFLKVKVYILISNQKPHQPTSCVQI